MGHWSLALLIGNIAEQTDCSTDPWRWNVLYAHHNTQQLPPQCCCFHPGAFLPSSMFGIPQQGCIGWPHSIIREFLRVPLHNVQPSRAREWVHTLWRHSSPHPWEAENEMCVNSKVFYYSVSSDSTTSELLAESLLFLDDYLSAVS